MTQAEVASLLRLSRAQYTAIENGRCMLTFAHMHNLATALNVKFVIGNSKSPSADAIDAS